MEKFFWDEPAHQQAIIVRLKQGKVGVCTTDTVLGLLADLSAANALLLNEIKGRTNKPYLILIESKDKVAAFVEGDKLLQAENLMTNCWPGPLTMIFNAKRNVAPYVQSAEGTVALRCPDHAGLLAILGQFDGLFSTSANLAGGPIPATWAELDPQIRQKVDFIVTDRNDAPDLNTPSTIIDCTQDMFKIVRQGAFTQANLEKIVGQKL